MERFVLSIIIPTKNRHTYAQKAVEQILSIGFSNVQVVVQDNSDDDRLRTMIDIENSSVKYHYNSAELSFVDNFDEAISLADGEYLCMIGDDDGVLNYIERLVLWAKAHNVDAIIPNTNIVYIWPGNEFEKRDMNQTGSLALSYMSTRASYVCPLDGIRKLMHQGAQWYQSTDMVKLYHGIVKKSCLDKVKDIAGKYFGGLSPDIYISVALSIVISKALKIDCPITISGICNRSGSADSATGKHTGELKDAPHFRGQETYVWAEEVPAIYSVETIWADSALHAMDDMKVLNLKKQFSKATLLMLCLKKYPQYKNVLSEYARMHNVSRFEILIKKVQFIYLGLLKRVVKRIFRRKNDVIRKYGLENILQAEQQVYLGFKDKSFSVEELFSALDNLMR